MPKELIISVSGKETKAAILDNDQVVEIYIEREKEQSIVGSICKGRVTKVLPGMQSAFVDIGLERDAFLYVSDFFEDTEEYDKIVTSAEEQVAKLEQGVIKETPVAETEVPTPAESPAGTPPPKYVDRRGRTRRARRSRLRGKRFEETAVESPAKPAAEEPAELEFPSILPGESLAKYQHTASGEPESAIEEPDESGSLISDIEMEIPPEEETEPSFAEEPESSLPEGAETFLSSRRDTILEDIGKRHETVVLSSDASASSEIPTAAQQVEAPRILPFAVSSEPEDQPEEPAKEAKPSGKMKAFSEPSLEGGAERITAAGDAKSSDETAEKSRRGTRPEEPPMDLPSPVRKEENPIAAIEEKESVISAFPAAVEKVPAEPDKSLPALAVKSSIAKNASEKADQNSELPAQEEAESTSALNGPEKTSQVPASQPPAQSRTPIPNKADLRNPSTTSRFYRHGPENRRRPHNYRDRKENGAGGDMPLIADLLKEGQEILVQVAKEPLGTKGARITSHIALPGRFLVYMPTVEHIGVSRKIDSDEERQRLKRIIQEQRGHLSGGFIVRTAGQGRGEEEFKSDIQYLSALWADIRAKAEKRPAPTVIHRDLNLVQRLLRDHLSPDFVAIRADNEVEYAGIVEFVHRFMPSMVSRVKLYLKETPIFEEFGVQAEIDKALRSKVWLKSGGYIVIDQAEALVAIDVNTGKYVGKSNKLEDTIVKTNLEAAKEIARQIRMRDLGGIIVCDFIDMEDRKNRQKVTQALEEALRGDKSPSKILQFNDFGLVAITRKRVKQSLLKTLCEPCSACSGSGMVKSPQTICYEIQSEVKKMAKTLEDREITLRVNPAVAKALKTDEAAVVAEIETTYKKEVIIKSDPLLQQEHFDIF